MTDTILNSLYELRSLTDKYSEPLNETVYEQSVRYGQLAYKAFQLKLPKNDFLPWSKLPKESKQAWIEVGTQIEKITLIENNHDS